MVTESPSERVKLPFRQVEQVAATRFQGYLEYTRVTSYGETTARRLTESTVAPEAYCLRLRQMLLPPKLIF